MLSKDELLIVDEESGRFRLNIPGRLVYVPLDRLRVASPSTTDRPVQRELVPSHVKKIAENFTAEAFSLPMVNFDGEWYWIMDGQQHVEAVKTFFDPEELSEIDIPCWCLTGLTRPEQGIVFNKTNDRRAMHPMDLFESRLTAGYPEEVAIDRILNQLGIKRTRNKNGAPNSVSAIVAVKNMYKATGGDRLRTGLGLLRDGFPGDRKAFEGTLIKAACVMVRHYGDAIDRSRMMDILHKTDATEILNISTGGAKAQQTDPVTAAVQTIVTKYNFKVPQKNRLEVYPVRTKGQRRS